MSAEEFWHGKPRLAVAYRDAEKIRRENRYLSEWRQGIYTFEALVTASPAFREMSKGVEHSYPSKPLFSTHSQEERKEQEEMERMEKNMAVFMAMANKFNEELSQKQSEEESGE